MNLTDVLVKYAICGLVMYVMVIVLVGYEYAKAFVRFGERWQTAINDAIDKIPKKKHVAIRMILWFAIWPCDIFRTYSKIRKIMIDVEEQLEKKEVEA